MLLEAVKLGRRQGTKLSANDTGRLFGRQRLPAELHIHFAVHKDVSWWPIFPSIESVHKLILQSLIPAETSSANRDFVIVSWSHGIPAMHRYDRREHASHKPTPTVRSPDQRPSQAMYVLRIVRAAEVRSKTLLATAQDARSGSASATAHE